MPPGFSLRFLLRCPDSKSEEDATGFFFGGSTGKTILPKIFGPLNFSKRTLICSGGKFVGSSFAGASGASVEGTSATGSGVTAFSGSFSVFDGFVCGFSALAFEVDFGSSFLVLL